jgi:hypothetical protein
MARLSSIHVALWHGVSEWKVGVLLQGCGVRSCIVRFAETDVGVTTKDGTGALALSFEVRRDVGFVYTSRVGLFL